MSEYDSKSQVSDELLVAFIDGELSDQQACLIEARIAADAELARRFEDLSASSLDFRGAFDELLAQAPLYRLNAGLQELPGEPEQRAFGRRGFLAAAAACVALGMAADRLLLGHLGATREDAGNWRQRVADYMALYTPQTLDNLPLDELAQRAQLQALGERLELALQPASVALPGAQLKRAQLLEYDGVPIGQITYLDARYGPLAFCITRGNGSGAALAQEQRQALNLVYWSDARHAYLLIGRNPPAALWALADDLRRRLAA